LKKIEIDYLIVGQGLAGTLLAHFLKAENQSVHLIDSNYERAASKVAAGITNPITGRFFVKSWRVEELIPFADAFYKKLEAEIGVKFHHKKNFLRALEDAGAENDWLAKTANEGYERYLADEADASEFEGKIQPVYGFGEVRDAAKTDIKLLVETCRDIFEKEGILCSEKFDYQQIDFENDAVLYKEFKAKKIIFCEGAKGAENPFFDYLPFRLSKGEVLIVEIPNSNFEKMLKHHIFLVPMGENRYWVGSFYERDYQDDLPTEDGRKSLLENLKATLDVPFEVIEHLSAIRPTITDRRPFLGLHPEIPTLAIFNGLGAKGASLGPFFAKQMTDFLVHNKEVEWEVSVEKRTRKYLAKNGIWQGKLSK
jgi:glycine oxidase